MAKIDDMLKRRGSSLYDPFSTQEEHGLTTAYMALQTKGASESFIVACFLHDIGHLLLDEHAGRADFLKDDKRHEDIGHHFLQRSFSAEITELVRLHVDAKRYLCATDAAYYAGLSEASKRSLELQGGAFTAKEAAAWAAQPYAEQASFLRSLEDEGKRLWKNGAVTQADLPSRQELLDITDRVLQQQHVE